jgi:hypothetical protein
MRVCADGNAENVCTYGLCAPGLILAGVNSMESED